MVSTPEQYFLPLVQDNEFLPPISRWTTLGGLFIVSTVGISIILTSVTKYSVTVKAAATVRPTGELRIVQATAEGTIKTIKVKENQNVRRFRCFTPDLIAMAEELIECEVQTVAMEATGVYWIPVFQILEAKGLEVKLVNAHHGVAH